MRTLLVTAALASVACGSGSGGIGAVSCGAGGPRPAAPPPAGSRMPSSIIDPYLKIQTALAQDRADDVRANAGEIATASTALGAAAMKIDTAAAQLASAGGLADAREKFGTLTDAVVAYMEGQRLAAPEGVRRAWCPMARKTWLQQGDTLANPYYGTSMPTCGEFR
jgi:Cu(I)/Ag(I) efflux system membrane fusion protein